MKHTDAERAVIVQERLDYWLSEQFPNEAPALLAAALSYQIGALVVRHAETRAGRYSQLDQIFAIIRAQIEAGAQ